MAVGHTARGKMVGSCHRIECVQGGALLWAGTTESIGAATVSGENMVTDNGMNGKGEGGAIGGGDILPRNDGGGMGHSDSLWREGVAVHTMSLCYSGYWGTSKGRCLKGGPSIP